MPAWLVWLIVAGVFAAAETVSLSFVLVMFAGGSALAAIAAAIGAPLLAQFIVGVAGTAVFLVGFRPVAMRHLTNGPVHTTGAARLVGKDAVVLSQVTGREGGLVRLNGAEWSARAAESEGPLPVGAVVRVVEIQGATAVVRAEQAASPTREPTEGNVE
jgi:membrane protein implicated in regulation of membrane protease activity